MSGQGDRVYQRNHGHAIRCLSHHELNGGVGVVVDVAAALAGVEGREEARAGGIDVVSEQDGLLDDVVDGDSDGVGKGIVELDDDVVGVVALGSTLLELKLQVQRRKRREGHVVDLLQGHNRHETTESLVLWFFAQPLPLSPAVGHSCIVGSLIGEVDRPHDTSLEVRSNGLILEHSEVSPVETGVAVHGGAEHTVRLFAAYHAVVANDLSRSAQEISSPISNQVVVKACAEDISAASEPAELIRVWSISEQVAVGIAVLARRVEEIVSSDHIESAPVRAEGEGAATDRGVACVTLLEIIEDNVFKESLAVVNRLFADNVKSIAEFSRHNLTVCRGGVHSNTDIADAASGRVAVAFEAVRPRKRCDV